MDKTLLTFGEEYVNVICMDNLQYPNTKRKRNTRIIELRQKGLRMPEIARMFGLTKQRVFAILKRAKGG